MKEFIGATANIKSLSTDDLSDYVINCMPGVFFLQTEEGKYLRWNKNLEDVSGYTAAEIEKLNALDFFNPTDKERVVTKINEAFSTGNVTAIEATIIRKTGELIPYHFIGCALLYNGQRCIVGTGMDITERMRTEKERTDNEQKYHALFQQATDAIFIADFEGYFIDVNDSMCSLLGYTKQELLAMHSSALIEPENLREFPIPLDKLIAGEHMLNKRKVIRKDGAILDFEINIKRLGDNMIMAIARNVTESNKAEQQLKESEKKYRTLIQEASDAITLFDLDGKFTEVNDQACILFGYTREELLEKSIMDMMPAEHLKTTPIAWEDLKAGKSVFNERLIVRKDGTIRNIEVNSKLFTGNKILGIVRDVTEKRRIQHQLDEAALKFRNLVEKSQVGVYIIQHSKFAYVNPRFCQIFGYTETELIDNIPFENVILPDDRAFAWEKTPKRADGENASTHYEIRGLKKDGSIIWLEVYGSRTMYNGEAAVIGTLIDITTRKKIQEEKERARYLLNERVKELTTLYNVGQILQEENRSMAEVLETIASIMPQGWQYPEIAGVCISYDGVQYMSANYTNGVDKQSAPFHTVDGINGYVEVVYTQQKPLETEGPFLKEERDLLNMLCEMICDYIERKRVEQQREKITADVIQRNNDLEQFGYIVSHNLRAPAANIIGFAEELMNDTNTESDKKIFIQHLYSSVKRLDEVIKDLNTILQVKREVTERKTEVSLTRLVESIKSSISHMIEKEKAQIVLDFAVDTLQTTKSYLHSIFYNLITNSIKYRQKGVAPHITISSRKADNTLVLTFKDNGMGIDLEKKGGQVFGLYKRFHTQTAEGKGMGLYMVKSQVESLGGKIHINSRVNEGTEFIIELPA